MTADRDGRPSRVEVLRDRDLICDRIRQWTLAAERQHDRVLASEDFASDWAEVGLLVVAVAQVRRACEMGGRHSREVKAALAAFTVAVPDVVTVRDVLTHFDEYDRGHGDLQKQPKNTPPPLRKDVPIWYENDGDTIVLHVDRYEFDSTAAWRACEALATTCLSALDPAALIRPARDGRG